MRDELTAAQRAALSALDERWHALPMPKVARPTAQVLASVGLAELADAQRRKVKAARDASFVRLTDRGARRKRSRV